MRYRFWAIAIGLGFVLLLAASEGRRVWRNRNPSFVDMVGVPLPASATEIKSVRQSGFDGGEYWLSAKMNLEDFIALMNQLDLKNPLPPILVKANLMSSYGRKDVKAWWCKSEDGDPSTYGVNAPGRVMAAKYEDGRLYLRVSFN